MSLIWRHNIVMPSDRCFSTLSRFSNISSDFIWSYFITELSSQLSLERKFYVLSYFIFYIHSVSTDTFYLILQPCSCITSKMEVRWRLRILGGNHWWIICLVLLFLLSLSTLAAYIGLSWFHPVAQIRNPLWQRKIWFHSQKCLNVRIS